MPRPMDTTRPCTSALESVNLDLALLTQGIIALREEMAGRDNGKVDFMLEGLDLLVERADVALQEAMDAARAQGVR